MIRPTWIACGIAAIGSIATLEGCGVVAHATKSGMKPILNNGIQGFVEEPDLEIAEGAILANMKLIEGIAATYPDDRDFMLLAAMARSNYAFAFVQDELEAVRIAYPNDPQRASALIPRVLSSYGIGRKYAERALRMNDDYFEIVGERRLEEVGQDELEVALEKLGKDDVLALFWLAFTWGGSLQVELDPAEATQLPKIEMIMKHVLAIDETVFYGVGAHLLAGVFYGFRAPALGGNPDLARRHFEEAKRLGGVMIPDVLRAQFVDAQIEDQASFERTLEAVIAAKPRADRALLESLAKRKACRLLANIDLYFLVDARPVPEACSAVSRKHPLRAAPGDHS